jgi:hypothetical protein
MLSKQFQKSSLNIYKNLTKKSIFLRCESTQQPLTPKTVSPDATPSNTDYASQSTFLNSIKQRPNIGYFNTFLIFILDVYVSKPLKYIIKWFGRVKYNSVDDVPNQLPYVVG